MENLPLISVLIPVYNVEEYVEEAVRSIMGQTYRNLEIVIVDDCSTDGTFEIVNRLAAEDERIKTFRNDKNSRIVETLNRAILHAKGTYFARMDGDDISSPERIERQLRYLFDNEDISLVGLNVTMIDKRGKEIHKERYLVSPDHIKAASEYVSPIPHFWLAKRELYDFVGVYRVQSAEDLDFILRSLDAGFKLANLSDFLYQQRMRDGNTATASGLMQRKSIKYVRELHKERVLSRSIHDSYTDEYLKIALSAGWIEQHAFKISAFFHFAYVQNKNKNYVLSLFARIISIIFSPKYQLSEVINRYRYKGMIRQIQKLV